DSPGSLDLTPVVAASLHSQLLPVVAAIRHRIPTARVAYVMTDGAALPAALSKVVRRMRELEWLCGVVTAGHAFGGDLEAVGVPSGVLAARRVLGADVVVAGMGPGVVGTSTRFGTSALELATIVMASKAVGGMPVVAVRMSSGDPRERHRGLSHHAVTALGLVDPEGVQVPVPGEAGAEVRSMLHRFQVVEVDTAPVRPLLEQAAGQGLEASHMGRTPAQDPLFFAAAGAAGLHAASLVQA
ncbi:MAG TPA: DUF3866 family protein, partial [Actinomycetota bacterium]|nr:DUF3866 family protein [Actinomycetota bacterium]